MKEIKVTDIGTIKNELRKYKAGKKLDINQFNQVARLAWLGKFVAQPLDANDPTCKSLLVYVDFPDDLARHMLNIDEELMGHMHIVDAEQGKALAKVLELGVQERAALYQDLRHRDFYFGSFYEPKVDTDPGGD